MKEADILQVKTYYKIKIGILLIFLITINTYVFMNRGINESSLNKEKLVVGMELKFPPFETVDEKGNPIGVSVDLAKAIGNVLDMPVEIKSMDYQGLIPALQSGQIDLVISSMTVTPERLESIAFSNEYAKSDLAFAINKDIPVTGYQELNDAKYTVAAKQGTVGAMWVKNNLPKAKLKEFTEVSAAILDVNNGASSAFIYDPLSLIESSKNLNQIKLLLEPLPGVKGWGIGMRKDDEFLKKAIDHALDTIKTEGFFESMREKYLKEEVKKYESYGLRYFF